MLQAANTDLLNSFLPKTHNESTHSECQTSTLSFAY